MFCSSYCWWWNKKRLSNVRINFCRLELTKFRPNSAAIKNPDLINQGAKKFGNQCIVIAIDAKKISNKWNVFINGGRINTNLDAIDWAKKAESLGAGEILLTSMDRDGTKGLRH